jgi:hypothetical protein
VIINRRYTVLLLACCLSTLPALAEPDTDSPYDNHTAVDLPADTTSCDTLQFGDTLKAAITDLPELALPAIPGDLSTLTIADSISSDTLLPVVPAIPPPPLDSLLLGDPLVESILLDTLLMYHATANWYDMTPWLGGMQTVGSGYSGHTLYLASGGMPSFLLPVSRDGVLLNNPASGLFNLNQLGFNRGARLSSADGLALENEIPHPDTILTDLDYRQAFYGNNRVYFRTQHPLPGGFFRGETRQQFFSGKMTNGKARENCTTLALYRYLFWRSWLVTELQLDRHFNGVWQSPYSTLERETHQRFALQLPGVAGSWRWRPGFRYLSDHIFQESPYDQGLKSRSWQGSLLLRKSFSSTNQLELLSEFDATEIKAESYQLTRQLSRGRLQWEFSLSRNTQVFSGAELLYEDERDSWLRSGWLQLEMKLPAELQWQLELSRRESFLPFSLQRGGAEVIRQYELIYPALRQELLTVFQPDPDAKSSSRWGVRSSISYTHGDGHLFSLTGWGMDFEDFPYLYVANDTTVAVRQRPNTLIGEEARIELFLPWQLRWLNVQSWQQDSEGLVSTELPIFRMASELRWGRLLYEGHLQLNMSLGLTSTWGAVRQNGEPLSDQLIPYLHLVAKQGNFVLYWSLQNPLSFENYAMEGVPGMHRDEIIGVMWRLLN